MRRSPLKRATLMCLFAALASTGCADELEDDSSDAPDAMCSPVPVPGVPVCMEGPPPAPEDPGASQLVFYTIGQDVWLASAAGTEARMICEDATVRVDADGSHALCVPNSDDAPLALFVLDLLEINQTYEDWRAEPLGSPDIDPDGFKIAYLTNALEGADKVKVADGGGNTIAEVEAFGVRGFAGSDTLVLDLGGSIGVWPIGSEEVRRVNGNNVHPVGPEGAGVVFETSDRGAIEVNYAGADGSSRSLGEGKIGGVFGRRILVVSSQPQGGGVARLYDAADPNFEEEIELPMVPFDRLLTTQLISPRVALLELQRFQNCPDATGRFAMETIWAHLEDGRRITVAETSPDPHVVRPDGLGERALVLDVDPCGTPLGTGRVVELDSGATTELSDYVVEPIVDGTISPDGRFVALSLETSVQIIDLALDPIRVVVAGTGAEGGRSFIFR